MPFEHDSNMVGVGHNSKVVGVGYDLVKMDHVPKDRGMSIRNFHIAVQVPFMRHFVLF